MAPLTHTAFAERTLRAEEEVVSPHPGGTRLPALVDREGIEPSRLAALDSKSRSQPPPMGAETCFQGLTCKDGRFQVGRVAEKWPTKQKRSATPLDSRRGIYIL